MKASPITVFLTLVQVIVSFQATGQEKKAHVIFRTPIAQYAKETSAQTTTAVCAVEAKNFARGYCKASSCVSSKKHLPDHCNCPPPGSGRIAGGKYYVILNPCEPILLYKRVVNPSKWTYVEYSFSRGPEGTVMPLTRENLRDAFSDDLAFCRKVDALFRNDNQLSLFDKLNNMFFVNWVYGYTGDEVLPVSNEIPPAL